MTPSLLSQIDGGCGGPVAHGRQPSRIAVGQNAVSVPDQRKPVLSDLSADGDVLIANGLRLSLQILQDPGNASARLMGGTHHAVHAF